VEYGESLEQAVVREVEEETGVKVRPQEVVAVIDRIHRDGNRVAHHFVIVDYLCEWLEGTPRAGSDAEAVALVGVEELPDYDLPAAALEVVREGLRRAGLLPSGTEGATISSNTLRLNA
jgi:ADP-ribose pyrophosphatase YjhB (NUDIX family)